jgi:hypothetical protein
MREQKLDHNLPVLAEHPAISASTLPPLLEPEPEEPTLPLSHYLWILKRHRWKILSFVFTCVVATLIISSRLTPIYESTATVDIDRQTPTGVIGQEAMRPMTNDADQFLATQIKLIQSDSVLRPVVEKYNLREVEGWDETLPDVDSAWATDAYSELLPGTHLQHPLPFFGEAVSVHGKTTRGAEGEDGALQSCPGAV